MSKWIRLHNRLLNLDLIETILLREKTITFVCPTYDEDYSKYEYSYGSEEEASEDFLKIQQILAADVGS